MNKEIRMLVEDAKWHFKEVQRLQRSLDRNGETLFGSDLRELLNRRGDSMYRLNLCLDRLVELTGASTVAI